MQISRFWEEDLFFFWFWLAHRWLKLGLGQTFGLPCFVRIINMGYEKFDADVIAARMPLFRLIDLSHIKTVIMGDKREAISIEEMETLGLIMERGGVIIHCDNTERLLNIIRNEAFEDGMPEWLTELIEKRDEMCPSFNDLLQKHCDLDIDEYASQPIFVGRDSDNWNFAKSPSKVLSTLGWLGKCLLKFTAAGVLAVGLHGKKS